jgi:hypothetical protein
MEDVVEVLIRRFTLRGFENDVRKRFRRRVMEIWSVAGRMPRQLRLTDRVLGQFIKQILSL